MNTQDYQEDYMKGSKNLLKFGAKNIKLLIGVAAVAAILAFVFSSPTFITPKYESTAIIYPSNVWEYSDETALEQIQQYLESNAIRDSLVKKFDLYNEYKIDTADINAGTWMKLAYGEHVGSSETKFESIKITVLSTSPVRARDMVLEIIKQLNFLVTKVNRKKVQEIIVYKAKVLENVSNEIDSLLSIVHQYGKDYKVMDYAGQSERVTEGYLKALSSGARGSSFDETKSLFENVAQHGAYIKNLNVRIEYLNEQYAELLAEFEELKVDKVKEVTYSNVLVTPEVPDKKAYPVRWLIVALSMIGAVIFTATVLILSRINLKD